MDTHGDGVDPYGVDGTRVGLEWTFVGVEWTCVVPTNVRCGHRGRSGLIVIPTARHFDCRCLPEGPSPLRPGTFLP